MRGTAFRWDGEGYHNVYKMADLAAYESCTFGDDGLLGEVSPLVLPPFTAPGTFYYACRMYGHCYRDMKVIINVLPAPTSPASTPSSPPPSPRMPLSPPPEVQTPPPSSPRPPPPESPPPQPKNGPKTVAVGGPLGWNFGFSWPDQPVVRVGNTLEFTWTSAHDVFLFLDESAYDTCDFTRATVLGEGVDTTLLYTVEYEMTYYFGCSVGPHCTVGRMKVAVPVV